MYMQCLPCHIPVSISMLIKNHLKDPILFSTLWLPEWIRSALTVSSSCRQLVSVKTSIDPCREYHEWWLCCVHRLSKTHSTGNNSSSASSLVAHYYSQLGKYIHFVVNLFNKLKILADDQLLQKLYSIYKFDFLLFGYNFDDFLQQLQSAHEEKSYAQ